MNAILTRNYKFTNLDKMIADISSEGYAPTHLCSGKGLKNGGFKSGVVHKVNTQGYKYMYNRMSKFIYFNDAMFNAFDSENGVLVLPYDEPWKNKFVKIFFGKLV